MPSIIILTGLFCILNLVPYLLGQSRLPSGIVYAGSNSLALAAACHRPTTSMPNTIRQRVELWMTNDQNSSSPWTTASYSTQQYFSFGRSLEDTEDDDIATSTDTERLVVPSLLTRSILPVSSSLASDPLLRDVDFELQERANLSGKLSQRKIRWGQLSELSDSN